MPKDHTKLLGIVGLLVLAGILGVPIAYLARPAPRVINPHYVIRCDWHDWRLETAPLEIAFCGRSTPAHIVLVGREIQIGPLHFQRWF